MENRYMVTMDIKKGTILNARLKQGDTDSSVLEVKLIDNGVVVDITGQVVEFNFLRPDGVVTTQDSTNGVSILDATNGKFQCILKNSTLSVAGDAKCDIIFYKDGKELGTKTFNFTIDDRINSGLLSIASINAQIVELQTKIDEIKEAYEAAPNENSLLEVVNARGGEVDLATKIGKIESSLSEKANQSVVDIRDFGGMDDGTTDNRQPLLNAKIAAGIGGTILLPHTQGNNNNSVYYFSSNTAIDTQDIRLDVADGTKISYPGNLQYGQPLNLERDTKFISTIIGTERLYPKDQVKRHYIGESDIDKSTYSLPLTSDFVGKFITWQEPTVATATPTVIDTNNVKIGVGVGSQISALLLPLDIGQQLIANGKSFTGGGSGTPNFGVVALTTSGKYYFAYVGANTNGAINCGTTKSGVFVNPTARPMFGAYLSYLGANSLLSVERSGQNSFRAFANGVCITNGIVDMGDEISYLGFGAFNSGFTLTNFVVGNNIPFGGIEPLNFALFGDSRTADIYHNWAYTFKDAIDGSQGIRIGSLTNYAVGGHTSVQQLTTMQDANLTDVDYVIIDLGTNDIQTSVPLATYISNIASMVDKAISVGAKVVIGIPFLFYSSSFTGINNHPENYSGGALYRGALLQYASANGIKIVDTMRVVGMTTGDYDVVHDNIHPSFKTSELIGIAYAKAVLGDYLTIAK